MTCHINCPHSVAERRITDEINTAANGCTTDDLQLRIKAIIFKTSKIPSSLRFPAQLRLFTVAPPGEGLVATSAYYRTVPTCKVLTSDLSYFLRHRLTKKRPTK